MFSPVQGIAGGERPDTRKIVSVEMVQPTREQIEEFEITRTELQREIAPEKLQTHQNLFYSPSEQQIKVSVFMLFLIALWRAHCVTTRPCWTRIFRPPLKVTPWRFRPILNRPCERVSQRPTSCCFAELLWLLLAALPTTN